TPLSRRASAIVSPGADTQSGWKFCPSGIGSLDAQQFYARYIRPVDRARTESRNRCVVGGKNHSTSVDEIEHELFLRAGGLPGIARNEVGRVCSRAQVSQTTLQHVRTLGAELADCTLVALAHGAHRFG